MRAKTPIENQLTGAISAVTSGNKFGMIEHLIPQRLEDGKLINFKGVCIGTHDGEDQEFHPEGLEAPSRMTTAFVKRMTDPITAFITPTEDDDKTSTTEEDTDEEEAEAPVKEKKSKKGKKKKAEEAPAEEEEEDEDTINVGQIRALVDAGDKKSLKKAKKALEAQFAEDHPNYAELAKAIKKAKKALK